MDVHESVRERYSEGARSRQPALCCPVDYDQALLKYLPPEILERDYGCGDPSRYVRPGDTVLDLGCGGGKICYMAAQLVGPAGHVIGVDMNEDMLALARKYQSQIALRIGGDRVRFLKGYIQDLALDVSAMEDYLARQPVGDAASLEALRRWQADQKLSWPLVEGSSIDLVISNCVLNLVPDEEKSATLRGIHRVLRPGGRVAISDIVASQPVPQRLKDDPDLWSGCVSGAFTEHEFVEAFRSAGFVAVRIDKWSDTPWRVIEDIEFRSVTVLARKAETSECTDRGHAVIYRGPFSEVRDDEGHIYPRGQRVPVCDRTFALLTEGAYAEAFIGLSPAVGDAQHSTCLSTQRTEVAADEGESAGCDRRNSVHAGCC